MPAKTIAQLPHGSQICIYRRPNGNEIDITIIDLAGRFSIDSNSGQPLGQIQIEGLNIGGHRVYRVRGSACEDGWGPFLYDIAMESATKRSEGLLTGNSGLSEEAESVWKHYRDKRTDVRKRLLEERHPLRTPPSAVCDDFPFLWTKEPQIIDELKGADRIKFAKGMKGSCTDFHFDLG